MRLSKELWRDSRVFFWALFPVLCFCLCANPSWAGFSDLLNGATDSVLPGRAGSAIKAAVAFGKSFQDISPEQEYYIGRAVTANVVSTYPPSQNDRFNLYLNTLGQTLAMASDRPETFGGYHFLMLDSAEINAFAAPGGLILVTRGMVSLCKTEDALAAVLAHEISHVQGQHGLKSIKNSRLTSAFTITATEAAKSYGPVQISKLTEVFQGSITDITTTLMKSGYSRDLEREADKGAVTILGRVGYDPAALIVMLTEMKKQLKPGGLDFAKTHPDPKDRIEDIRPLVGSGLSIAPVSPERRKRFEAAMTNL
ncbi:MAG: M48 family metallopeptidase [Syntrophobacteraceae bacterium]|jgi:predicted Zn-dependent protease